MGNAKMYASASGKTKAYIWGWLELKNGMKKLYHRRFRRVSKQALMKDNHNNQE